MAVSGALLWGVSGTVAQYLFDQKGIGAEWLVSLRLIVSGFLFLLLCTRKEGVMTWKIWLNRSFCIRILLFGLAGMLGVQYTYFEAIETGNAAIATLLQYLAPLFILLYTLIRRTEKVSLTDWIGALLALTGTCLLLTGGSLSGLAIPFRGLLWGIASGAALAFYTLYSKPLLDKFSTLIIMGWGMIIGGLGMGTVHPVWDLPDIKWQPSLILAVGFIVIFGTLLAFYLYIGSLRYLPPHQASLLSCAEPISAVFSSVIWLNVSLNSYQYIGAALVILMTVLISLKSRNTPDNAVTA